MEIELAGFDRWSRQQREAKLKQYRRDLDEVRGQVNSEQTKYIQQKNKETMMGANLEEVVSQFNCYVSILERLGYYDKTETYSIKQSTGDGSLSWL